MQWYYVTNGQRQGPVGDEEIRNLVANGTVKGTDLVWNETMGQEWKPAGQVADLGSSNPAQPPPVATAFPATPGTLTPNRELMAQARACLAGKWGIAIAVMVVVQVIGVVLGFIPCAGPIVNLLIAGPLQLGVVIFFLAIARQQPNPEFGLAFSGFQRFGTALLALILVTLFTLLWMLLLIIPGIIASFRYALTFYVLADNPEMGALEAINRSKALMNGNKWKLFCLGWRFIGWVLIGVLTCGIGLLWVMPYMQTSVSRFYDDVRGAQTGQE